MMQYLKKGAQIVALTTLLSSCAGGYISGTLTSEKESVKGIEVKIYELEKKNNYYDDSYSSENYVRTQELRQTIETNSNGDFITDELSSGEYIVVPEKGVRHKRVSIKGSITPDREDLGTWSIDDSQELNTDL